MRGIFGRTAANPRRHGAWPGPTLRPSRWKRILGTCLVFNHNTKHAAFGGGGKRRMFTLNACQRYPEEMLPQLRDYLAGAARFWVDRCYTDTMMSTAGPQRRVHLEQVRANDHHLAELAAKAREEMSEPSRG